MCLICDKLQLKKGDTMLDIGCGWGTLARHAAKYYGAKSTGVTLSKEGAEWARNKNKEVIKSPLCSPSNIIFLGRIGRQSNHIEHRLQRHKG
jgi:16S rRNA G1207 methylase RsmC